MTSSTSRDEIEAAVKKGIEDFEKTMGRAPTKIEIEIIRMAAATVERVEPPEGIAGAYVVFTALMFSVFYRQRRASDDQIGIFVSIVRASWLALQWPSYGRYILCGPVGEIDEN